MTENSALARVNSSLQLVAEEVTTALAGPPERLAEIHRWISGAESVLEDLKELVKARLQAAVKQNGVEIGEGKGSKQVELGDFKVRMMRARTGPDPKKVTALLYAKDIPLVAGMDTTTTYHPNLEKLHQLVGAGRLTAQELLACEYDETYRLEVKPRGSL